LIQQQNGLAKANPLSMHNKTLIWGGVAPGPQGFGAKAPRSSVDES
jgi:hypothetical protein